MYTHCPKCNTHFEITQEYLDIANGQVRCGNCDHIFNASTNLYNHDTPSEAESQDQSPEDVNTDIAASEQESPETAQAEISKPQSLTDPEKESTGKIDLKEKMERIVASLSAATQELKNARNATSFHKPATDSIFSKVAETESENKSFLQNYSSAQADAPPEKDDSALINNAPEEDDNAFINDAPEIDDNDLINDESEEDDNALINDDPEEDDNVLINDEPEEDDNALINDDPEEDDNALINDDPEEDDNVLINDDPEEDDNVLINDEPEENDNALINDEPEEDDNTLINDAPEDDDTFESTDIEQIDDIFRTIDKSKSKSSNTFVKARTTQLEDTPETTETAHIDEVEETEKEDELDIVNVVTKDSAEPDIPSALDFRTNKVDSNDIDVLNGLIDDSDRNSSNNELYEKLDNLNNSLSDDAPSLDDEFSELDNGNELLAELDQLESKFITNKQAAEEDEPTLDDLYEAEANNVKQEDTDQITIENIAEANVPHEEIVPSFLTQSHSTHSSPASILGWLTATIVLLLVLFSQYLHFNSVKFSQHSEIRPLLETLCPLTGCYLPLIRTPKKIVTVTHNVRTHPNIKNALEIQLTFKNKASYTQSFPILEITFSNPVGEIVAQRRFSPDEYHINESQFQQGLKSNQSYEIHLKVVDPDPGALLSFQFNYL